MTVLKQYVNGSWQTIVVGQTGSTGASGPVGASGDWSSAQTIKDVSTSSYTVISSDVGKILKFTNVNGCTVYVPTGLGFSSGQRIDIIQYTDGQCTFSGASTIRYTNTLKTRAKYSTATLLCLGGNEYLLTGDLGTM